MSEQPLRLQIHLTYFSPSEMMVTYVTGDPSMEDSPTETSAAGTVPTLVRYSTQQGGPYYNATGWSEVYQQIYTFSDFPNINYTSPLIHHARLTGGTLPAQACTFISSNEELETCLRMRVSLENAFNLQLDCLIPLTE
jgi:hypothetical protein